MNGPDETAGSRPSRFMRSGRPEPTTEPKVTHATRDMPTAAAMP